MALLINIINMQRDGDTSNRTVFLGDLPFQGAVDDFQEIKKTVREAFNAQDVEDVKIKDRKVNEGVSFIFAFVSFKTEEAADRAIAAKTVKIGSKEVKVERYIPERDYQLYIKGVSNLEQKDIEEFFGKAGKVSLLLNVGQCSPVLCQRGHHHSSGQVYQPGGLREVPNATRPGDQWCQCEDREIYPQGQEGGEPSAALPEEDSHHWRQGQVGGRPSGKEWATQK